MTKRPDIIITSDDAAASKRQEIRSHSTKLVKDLAKWR